MSNSPGCSASTRAIHKYAYIGRGLDLDGFMKINLRRDDGREVQVAKKRYRQLQREGRINPDCYGVLSSSDTGGKS